MTTAKKTTAVKKAAPARNLPAVRDAVAIAEGAELELYELPTSSDVAAAIKGNYKLHYEGAGAEGSILADTLENAESAGDLFGANELSKIEDHLGETLTIMSIDGVNNSDFADGLGLYLIVTAATLDGERIKVAVGAADPMGKILKLHELGSLPWALSFERSTKATKRGFYPINTVNRQLKDGGTF